MITTIIPCVGVSGNSAFMFTLALPTFSANVPHIYATFTACMFSLSFPAFSANVSHIYAMFTAMPSYHFWLLPSMIKAKNWLQTRGDRRVGGGALCGDSLLPAINFRERANHLPQYKTSIEVHRTQVAQATFRESAGRSTLGFSPVSLSHCWQRVH